VKGGIWRNCGRFLKKGKWLKGEVAEGRNSRGMERGNRGMEGRWSFPTD